MQDQNQSSGQRSIEWHKKKAFRWGASTNAALMSEGKLVPKAIAGDLYKVAKYTYGDGALTAIFNMFEARLSQTMKEDIKQTWEMERGEELEPEGKEAFLELYLDFQLVESEELVKTGFILNADDNGIREFEKGYKGENSTGGASPDGCLYKNGILVASYEMKCRGKDTTNSHAYRSVCECHKDFYQVQSQMLALNVDKCYYVHYDDRLPSPWNIKVQVVARSPMHTEKIKKRQKDADKIIADWIKHVGDVNAMMPHERDAKILEVREMCDNLKEVW